MNGPEEDPKELRDYAAWASTWAAEHGLPPTPKQVWAHFKREASQAWYDGVEYARRREPQDLRKALEHIANVLGPGTGDCAECQSMGCNHERREVARTAAEALASLPQCMPVNQCDGCQAGMPINDFGNHTADDKPNMACEKDKYGAEK